MLPSAMSSERRRFGRRDTSISATVSVRGRPSLPCTILNFSETGALLEFREPSPTAHMFRLIVGNTGIEILCQVRHRAPRTLGIAFVGGAVARFVEEFRPQPLMPIQTALKVDPSAGTAPASELVADATEAKAPATTTLEADPTSAEPNEPAPASMADTEALTPGATQSMLVALADRLLDLPEFEAAGFRLEVSDDETSLIVCQRMVRRGEWREEQGYLIWTPTGLGLEPHEASSVEDAALLTMMMVLTLLQRRMQKLNAIAAHLTALEPRAEAV